jgi:hypothetical protein
LRLCADRAWGGAALSSRSCRPGIPGGSSLSGWSFVGLWISTGTFWRFSRFRSRLLLFARLPVPEVKQQAPGGFRRISLS